MASDEHPAEEPVVLHYFVDEAGDPVLFDRSGRVRAGTEGCSKYFMLGKLDVDAPEDLDRSLANLRTELLKDPYFKGVPSMQSERGKTALLFHAKDDLPEVRREVFKVLTQQRVRFYAVVRDKLALVKAVRQRNKQDSDYRYSQNDQYDSLVSDLFRKFHYSADITHVCFAKRGTKNRTAALYKALEKAKAEFQQSYGFSMHGEFKVESSTPKRNTALQAVDYYLWALQRFYERGEERYLEFIWPHVGEVHDLDRIEDGRVGVVYGKKRPLLESNDDET